jgi:hypothetical protein
VIDADLSGYFDSIPHRELLGLVARRVSDGRILALIKAWLRAPIVERDPDTGRPTITGNHRGTPQGGVISPLLANLYLNRLDWQVNERCELRPMMVRYAEDFVILSRPGQGAALLARLKRWLRAQGLTLNEAKTRTLDVRRRPLEHLLCHVVLPYSNWSWATRCQSESLLSLRHGLQEALHQLGRAPERLQMDNSSAATHRIGTGGREFNRDFLALTEHYGLKPQTIGIRKPHENGDVESRNGHLKRRLKQHLLLRGCRDFEAAEAYGPSRAGRWRASNLRRYLNLDAGTRWPEMTLKPELRSYDALLERPMSHE